MEESIGQANDASIERDVVSALRVFAHFHFHFDSTTHVGNY